MDEDREEGQRVNIRIESAAYKQGSVKKLNEGVIMDNLEAPKTMRRTSCIPHPDFRYWLCDPEGEGMVYYHAKEDRDAAARAAKDRYFDDEGWYDDDVLLITAGEVTHSVQMPNKKMRPADEDLDANGCDVEGIHWPPGMGWRGTYTLESLG